MPKTKAQIIAEAQVVKNATEVGENTATRVGTVLEDLAEKINEYVSGRFYGYAATSADLPEGDEVGYAYVGSSPFEIWNFDGTTWSDSGATIANAPVPNMEDIDYNTANELQFANRVYNSTTPDGLGYKILRKSSTFAAQVTEANTIYEIRYDFDLDGQTATIPAGSTLKFNGGTINNGEIIVNQYSKIIGGQTTLYNVRIKLKGQGIEISDVNIDIVNAQYAIPYRNAILSETDNVSNLVIKNVNISSSNGGGIKIITDNSTTATRNILIKNCHITHALMGIELQNHTNNQHLIKDVDISNCAFELYTTNSGEYNYGFNISLTGTGNNVNIHDNTFKACAIGVECIGFDDVKINNNSFLRDDTIKTSRPLSFESIKGSSNILINNNYFELGISLVKVTGGTFENNVIIETYKKYSIEFRDCSNIIINNNFVSSGFPTFIAQLSSCINCVFSNNILIATSASQGLRIKGNSAYNRVSGNSVTLPDNRLAITDETDDTSDTYNLIVNNYQRKASIVWKTKDMVDLYESSVSTNFFKTYLASKTNLWINIYGVMNLTSAVTVPEGYTLNFVGGMVKSESLRSMIGGGEGPVITGAIKSENVNFTGKWRTINGFTIANNKGITDSRPVLSQKDLGFQYFDTTLGKYICWNGTAWINMDGTALA